MPTFVRYALYGLFALSGFCGLVYESIWSHYLRNYLGHAAHGQTVVLVIFVGGLALGAWLAGRVTARLREPLLAYAAAELVVGVAALAFHPVFVGVTGWSYATLLPAACSESSWCVAQWIVAALLIVLPAVALGATFPWMAAGVLRRYPAAPGHEISVLYFLNSIGGVFGVLASAFVLIPWLGLPGTLQAAAALNVLVALGVGAIALARRAPAVAVAAEPAAPATAVPPRGGQRARGTEPAAERGGAAKPAARPHDGPLGALVTTFLAVAALTGLASFVYEIVWIRMLALVLGSATHSFELMLAAFILGLALGGAWIRHRIDRIADPRAFLGHVQVLMGLAAALTLPLYTTLFDGFAWLLAGLAGTEQGYALFHVASAAVAAAVMLPATILAGMTLPLITHRLLVAGAGERAIGNVYAANTVGAILGVVVAVHVLVPGLGLKGALLAGAALDLLLGIFLLWQPRGAAAFGRAGFATVLIGLGVFGALAAAVKLDPQRLAAGVFRERVGRLPDAVRVIYHADGKTASVAVVEAPTRRMLRTNGKTDASVALPGQPPTDDEPTQALLGALALGANPQARRAAVIGLGSGVSSAVLLADAGLERVDSIEIEPLMVEGAKRLSDRAGPVFADPRSHVVADDAKAFLARVAWRYDIIVSEPSNPWVSGVASLFTAETYGHIARHLTPTGVFVQWIQLYEADAALLASIFRALAQHLPHYVVYGGGSGDLLVVASPQSRPQVDAAALFARPEVARQLRAAGVAGPRDVDARWLGNDRTVGAMMSAFAVPANSDYRPYVEQNAPRARFLGANARPYFQAEPTAVPMIEMLAGGRPRAAGASADTLAAALAKALAAPADARPELPSGYAGYADALRATRELFVTCRPGGDPTALLDGAIALAAQVNVGLDASSAEAAWTGVKSGACYRGLPPQARLWADLFAAAGARDAVAMATLAPQAMGTAATPAQTDYALAAGVTGELARNEPGRATRILDQFAPRAADPALERPWITLLRQTADRHTLAPAPSR